MKSKRIKFSIAKIMNNETKRPNVNVGLREYNFEEVPSYEPITLGEHALMLTLDQDHHTIIGRAGWRVPCG